MVSTGNVGFHAALYSLGTRASESIRDVSRRCFQLAFNLPADDMYSQISSMVDIGQQQCEI